MIAQQTTRPRPRLVDLDALRCAGCGEPLAAGSAGELAHSDGTTLCRGHNGQPAEPVEQ